MLVPSPRSSKAAEDPRTKLRRLIKRKTSERDRLRQEIEQCNAAMAPLAVKQATMEAMDEEIHGLFRRILERAKPRKREHQRLRQLYEQLQEDGIISPDPERAEQTAQRCDCPACSRANATDPWPSDPFTGQPTSAPDDTQGHPPAPRPARDSGVRALYHKLALHFHPDRAQGEQRAAHEAVMREVNDAYHGGDTERLIALSRELGIDVGELESSDGLLGELVRQYEQVKAEVRDLRDSMLGFLVADMRRAQKNGYRSRLQKLQEEAEFAFEELTGMRDFIRDFADGKVSVKDFIGEFGASSDVDVEEMMELAIDGLMGEFEAMLNGAGGAGRRNGAKGKGGSRRG